MRKVLSFCIVLAAAFILLLTGNFPVEISLKTPGFESNPLVILNPHSNPKTGSVWEVRFVTEGKDNLSFIPADDASIHDLEFLGLYCGEEKVPAVEVAGDIIVATGWECNTEARVQHLVHTASNHHLQVSFGDASGDAYNSPIFSYAKRFVDAVPSGFPRSYDVQTDSNDNIYIAGMILGDFDMNNDGVISGDGESSVGYGNRDLFITVFDSAGNHLWAKRLGGIGSDRAEAIILDEVRDRLYIGGYVTGNADLNGDGVIGGSYPESSAGYGDTDVVISAFNLSGTHQWAKRLGGTSSDWGNDLAVDSSGNVGIVGFVSGNADMNGNGNSTDGGAEDATGYGLTDAFITVFNSSGTHQWAERLGGTGNDTAYGVAVDGNDQFVIVGNVTSHADLDGDGSIGVYPETSPTATRDAFITTFNSSGVHQWAKRLGGASANDRLRKVAIDSGNNIYAVGNTNGDADLDGDGVIGGAYPENSTGYGGDDIIIVSFNSSGTYRWAKRLGNSTTWQDANNVAVDNADNVIMIGYVDGSADLNGDGVIDGIYPEDNTGYDFDDVYASAFDSSGNHLWALRLGGTDYDEGNSVAVDSSDNVILLGYVVGDADLTGDGDTSDPLESGGSTEDLFYSVFNFDVTPPTPSNFNPASGSTITTATPTITFDLDENGDCRAGLTDEGYTDMSDDIDCTGDGTQSMSCDITDLGVDGSKTVYIACQDTAGNMHTSETNIELSYTLDTSSGGGGGDPAPTPTPTPAPTPAPQIPLLNPT